MGSESTVRLAATTDEATADVPAPFQFVVVSILAPYHARYLSRAISSMAAAGAFTFASRMK